VNNIFAAQFTKTQGIKVEEVLGSYHVTIDAGGFCAFDKNTPSNGVHYHNCYEICLVTGGSGEFIHNNETYLLNEGDVFIANPGALHEIRLLKGINTFYEDNLYVVFFRIIIYSNTNIYPKIYEEKMLKEFLASHTIIRKAQKHLFSYLYFIENYTGLSANENYGLYQVVRNLCYECLFSLVKVQDNLFQKKRISETIIDQVINYIGANLHRKIYLREIAANSCTSQRNLQLIFKKYMNQSISDYINQRKTAVAAGYLKMNFKIPDVSTLIGIDDLGQFSRLFKKYYGIAPKKYQMLHSTGGMVFGASFTH